MMVDVEDLPAFLHSDNVVNDVAIKVREHARQRLDHDSVLLTLYPARFFSLRTCLPSGCVFSTEGLSLFQVPPLCRPPRIFTATVVGCQAGRVSWLRGRDGLRETWLLGHVVIRENTAYCRQWSLDGA